MYHVQKPDSKMRQIAGECFGYTGNTFKLSTAYPHNLRSYWDGGSRSYYAFYSLVNGKCSVVESNHPLFEAGKPYYLEKLPERVLLVEHSIFCGKDHGITIYANESDLAPMLPAPTDELTEAEKIVLTFTKCFKASYGGNSNVRYTEAKRVHGITGAAWQTAKTDLIEKGLLNKVGAITAAGRNAIEGKEARHF